ncbi:MAG: terminase small subunit protein [Phenylobacterium sp.]|nr:terminase small subunit protein [Phenylobacterium sp.]
MSMIGARQALGAGPRESFFTPELGAAVCARVEAGASLQAIGAEAGMPSGNTIYNWAKAHPAFCTALSEARASSRVARRVRERSVVAAMRAAALANPRGNGGRATCRYAPAIGEAICERIAEGESLMAICRDPETPCLSTIYNWLKAFPVFADMYVEARLRQADTYCDEVREVGLAATPGTVWADRLRFDTLRWLTARLAPKKYCEKIMVVEAMRGEAEPGGLTVIVKKYSDITPEEYARAEEGEP